MNYLNNSETIVSYQLEHVHMNLVIPLVQRICMELLMLIMVMSLLR